MMQQLRKMFFEYGELKNGGALASTIVNARKENPIKSTDELKKGIRSIFAGS